MTSVALDSKVAFLRRPAAYAHAPTAVTPVETHMSWVFLTDHHAYKLKKPIRCDGADFTTSALRRRNCEKEVRLNRRLAPDVYMGVVPLTREPHGELALNGRGEPVDWLVEMRRLRSEHMLDVILAESRVTAEEPAIRAAAGHLARFYAKAPPEAVSVSAFCQRLSDGVRRDLAELSQPRYGLPLERIAALARAQLAFVDNYPVMFEQRIDAGRIVDGHGDLRPEHICVRPEPAIIDCLEFTTELRVVDPADELGFLALECERLGDRRAGQWFLETYRSVTRDEPPASLLHFYRVYRALRRATLAVRHLDDPSVANPARFAARARHYLELVEPLTADAIGAHR
jgi:aminoglycoside phosphotransferase family enzyme